jgi:TetR/AcrR family transcriptional repressor of mexJK operon
MKENNELKEKILNCSKKIFSEKGYTNTTIREIADAVNVSPGTIYTYFKNKQALFDSLNIPNIESTQPKHDLRKKEILSTALILFGERGYDGVTMDTIASKLHISKSTLYSYFSSKAELFASLLQQSSFNLYTEKLNIDTEKKDLREIILSIGRSYLQIGEDPERAALFKTVIRDSCNYPELGTVYFEQGINPACNNIMEYINANCARQNIPIKSLHELHTFVLTYIATLQSYILMHDVMKGIPAGVEKDDYLEVTTDIFLNYLQKNGYI